MGIICNGYPHYSLEALNLDDKYQAYYATKMALWCYLMPGWNINNLKVAPGLSDTDQEIAKRVLDAATKIYKRGTTYNYMLEPKLTATPDRSVAYPVTVDGRQYKQQIFTIQSETSIFVFSFPDSHTQPCFDGGDQSFLRHVFAGQRRQHILVHRVLAYDVVDRYDLALALTPETRVCLLVQFQAPRQPKPDEDMPTALDVQPMSRRCRMDQRHGEISLVPVPDILGGLDIRGMVSRRCQVLYDPLAVVLEPVCDQNTLPVYIFFCDFFSLRLSSRLPFNISLYKVE